MDFAERAGNDLPAGARRHSNTTEPSVKGSQFHQAHQKKNKDVSICSVLTGCQCRRKGTRGVHTSVACVCVCVSYLMHEHEAAGQEAGEAQWQPACGPARRRRRRERGTGLSAETLPSHRTSFPPVASDSLQRLNLRRPHREDAGREGGREGGLLSTARVM